MLGHLKLDDDYRRSRRWSEIGNHIAEIGYGYQELGIAENFVAVVGEEWMQEEKQGGGRSMMEAEDRSWFGVASG